MKCEVCQERLATLHLTNYANGQKTEIHLCQTCAAEHGYIDTNEEAYTIHDLLSGFFNVYSQSTEEADRQKKREAELTCPQCQMTYQQFSKLGKFGCSTCYETFSDYLDPVFKRVHGGNTKHVGKISKRQHAHLQHKRLIQTHRNELKELVKEEKFEEAAKLRDKIKELEQEESPSQQKGDEN